MAQAIQLRLSSRELAAARVCYELVVTVLESFFGGEVEVGCRSALADTGVEEVIVTATERTEVGSYGESTSTE